mmetsp:Transcript_11987/g.10585  ORF Transcript_11987/g.10585 Transcript_11987/m.10585 type:complete len:137 (+) Transcript_11987:41-451(+)
MERDFSRPHTSHDELRFSMLPCYWPYSTSVPLKPDTEDYCLNYVENTQWRYVFIIPAIPALLHLFLLLFLFKSEGPQEVIKNEDPLLTPDLDPSSILPSDIGSASATRRVRFNEVESCSEYSNLFIGEKRRVLLVG